MKERITKFHQWIGSAVLDLVIWSTITAVLGLVFAAIGGTHFDIFLNDATRTTNIGKYISMSVDFGTRSWFFQNKADDISGDWTGIFKEWCPKDCADSGVVDSPQYVIDRKKITLTQWGGYLRGTSQTPDVTRRSWSLVGQYRGNMLTISYEAIGAWRKENPNSAGTYVLKPDSIDNNSLTGYWTGWDYDLYLIVTCPFVMVRDLEPELRSRLEKYLIRNNLKDHMALPCTPDPKREAQG